MNMNEYYKQLEGAQIVKYHGIKGSDEYTDGFPTFTVRMKNGEVLKIEVSRDEEGNDGGFLFIGGSVEA